MKYFIIIALIICGCNSDRNKMKQLIKERDEAERALLNLKSAEFDAMDSIRQLRPGFNYKNFDNYMDSMDHYDSLRNDIHERFYERKVSAEVRMETRKKQIEDLKLIMN